MKRESRTPSRRSAGAAPLRLALIAAFLALPLLANRLHPHAYAGGRSRSAAQQRARNTSALATAFGEFRTSMSDIMYLKTERYLDYGIAYLPHSMAGLTTKDDSEAVVSEPPPEAHEADHDRDHAHADAMLTNALDVLAQAELDHDDHAGHAHGPGEPCEHTARAGDDHAGHGHEEDDAYAGTPTVIPEPGRDFRGFIGELHRRVKPWRDPARGHIHSDGKELLPWFRLLTLTDPHYVRGYTVGGWWLKRRNPEAAESFLDEGLRHNPEAFQIHVMKGFLLIDRARSLTDDIVAPTAEARAVLEQARDAYRTAAELAVAQRPADFDERRTPPGVWSYYDENDAVAACRMAVVLERRYGDPARAAELARRYASRIPEDDILRRLAEEG